MASNDNPIQGVEGNWDGIDQSSLICLVNLVICLCSLVQINNKNLNTAEVFG